MDINIKMAEVSDIKSIMEIEAESFDADTVEREHVYLERVKYFNDGALVLKQSNEVMGFIFSEIWNRTHKMDADLFRLEHSILNTLDVNGSVLYISSFAISKKCRGFGYGEKLFQYLIKNILQKYQNVQDVLLLVGRKWKAAQRIYIKNGFEVVKNFENFFGGTKESSYDGIVMKKKVR